MSSSYSSSAVCVGPDTSNVNGRAIDSAWLKRHGMPFHFFKVSQGVWFRDRLAAANHRVDASVGVLEGRYHFLESDTGGAHPASGSAQCDAFIAACLAVGGDCRTHGHAVDVEAQAKGLGPRYRVVADFVRRWRQRMPGCPLGVYSGSWYWVGWMGNPPFAGDWLWSSDYVAGSGDAFALLGGVTPGYWHPWGGRRAFDLRQFSSSAQVDGISPCDVSVYPGLVAGLRRLWLPAPAQKPPVGPVVAKPPVVVAKPPPVKPAPWKPPAEVVALQKAWHVPADGMWGNLADAHAHAIRRNHHGTAEQVAVGTAPDGVWGKDSEHDYLVAVGLTQRALNLGLPRTRQLRVDCHWGDVTDAAWRAARARFYLHFISG